MNFKQSYQKVVKIKGICSNITKQSFKSIYKCQMELYYGICEHEYTYKENDYFFVFFVIYIWVLMITLQTEFYEWWGLHLRECMFTLSYDTQTLILWIVTAFKMKIILKNKTKNKKNKKPRFFCNFCFIFK